MVITKKVLLVLLLIFWQYNIQAQTPAEKLIELEQNLSAIESQGNKLKDDINKAKWSVYMDELKSYGLPSDNYLQHTGFFFEYDEAHEQSKWIAHMITPEVEDLGSARTNDFRVDPLVTTGTAEQTDYFNYYPEKAKKHQYEGFGYDRGHLAPSADFRWYGLAVSESYFYSNMSPQHPDLNREKWADLESFLRGYVIKNKVALAVITAPILTSDLPKIKQSPNGVSIPASYIKIAYDATNKRTIGFVMANKELNNALESYAVSVDEIEKLTGYNYFPNIEENLESSFDVTQWFSDYDKGSVEAIKQNTLPLGHYNTIAVASQMNKYKKVIVCGKVVSSRNSRKGHAWINLDKKYPNDYFSVMIYKEQLPNFTYNPVQYLKGKEVCVEGEVGKFGNKPVMKIEHPEQVVERN